MCSDSAFHLLLLFFEEDGQVFSWGWNKYGQLGVGDSIDRNTPTQVPIEGCRPKKVACGWWHTLLLAETPLKS
ncbi:ultraviolet-B receptor UVR8-like [Populus alba x Populus x berolinensis]|nr:ultraviolet-B receptor UVR8-like [Populus alba x Populus x berolinensis]